MSTNREIDELVHEIRTVLSMPEGADGDLVSRVANSYSRMSERINDRLSDASSKLKRGLISEAIHALEQTPDALHGAAELELGDKRQAWISLCSLHGVQPIGPLTDLAVELNRSYVSYTRIEPLIRQYRISVLSGAPLAERIECLRKLHTQDAMNPSWRAQLQTLERKRLEEIEAELTRATERSDLNAIGAMFQELRLKDRLVPAPEKLLELAAQSHLAVRKRLAQVRVAEIARQLHALRAESNWESALELCRELDLLVSNVGVRMPPDIEEQLPSVRDWVQARQSAAERLRSFNSTLDAIERALDDGDDFTAIERLYAQAMRAELPIPKPVEQRYLQRRRQVMLDRTRKYRMIAAATIGAIAIAAFTVVRIMNKRALESSIATWAAQLEQSLDNHDFNAAEKLSTEIRAGRREVADAPRIVALLERADSERKREDERHATFVAALEKLQQLKGFEYESPAAIARAKALASGDDEMRLFAAERERLNRERLIDQGTRDEPFRRMREELSKAVAATEALEGTERATRLRSISAQFDSLLETKGISESELKAARAARDSAIADATLLEQTADRKRRLVADLEALPSAARSIPQLIDEYREFVNRYPESAQAARIDASLQHSKAWELIAATSSVTSGWMNTVIPDSKEDALSRAIELEGFLRLLTNSPDMKPLGDYLEVLKHFGSQNGAPRDALGIQPVRELLSRDWIKRLRFIKDSNGRTYYTMEGLLKPMTGGFYSLSNYVNNLESLIAPGGPDASALLKPDTPAGVEPSTLPAPITKLGSELLAVMNDHPQREIDSIHIHLAATIIADNATDPILRLALITDVLRHHIEAGRPEEGSVSAFVQEASNLAVKGERVIDMDWTDNSSVVIRGREIASNLLKTAPDFNAIMSRFAASRSESLRALKGWRIAGVVWTDASGEKTVRPSAGILRGDLYSVSGDETKLTFQMIGTADAEGRVQFTDAAPELATLVFTRGGVEP